MIIKSRSARFALFCVTAVLAFSAAAWSQGTPASQTRSWDIYFELNKADLLPQSSTRLDEIIEVLRANPSSRATVVGHTCDVASVAHNRALASRRARAAKRYMTAHGIAASRITASGRGSSTPKYDNATPEGKIMNRRVEITVNFSGSPNATASTGEGVYATYVAVLDDSGMMIADLPASNFKVFHDGAERQIVGVTYEGSDAPLSIVLALDKSASMQAAMPAMRDAAKGFIRAKKPGDLIQIAAFSSDLLMGNQFSDNVDELCSSVDRLQAGGYTRLYDAIFHSSLALAASRPPRLLIVLTDGKDEEGMDKPGSRASIEQALIAAQRSHVTVITMGLGNMVDQRVLQTIASTTGGANFAVAQPSHLAGLFQGISQGTMRGRYRIDFKSDVDTAAIVAVRSRTGQVIGYK